MSQAFVKDEDAQWLHDIPGTQKALLNFLTNENNGIRVYVLETIALEGGKEAFKMSNGLSYTKDEEGKWMVV